jgi:hypothetical protein
VTDAEANVIRADPIPGLNSSPSAVAQCLAPVMATFNGFRSNSVGVRSARAPSAGHASRPIQSLTTHSL